MSERYAPIRKQAMAAILAVNAAWERRQGRSEPEAGAAQVVGSAVFWLSMVVMVMVLWGKGGKGPA